AVVLRLVPEAVLEIDPVGHEVVESCSSKSNQLCLAGRGCSVWSCDHADCQSSRFLAPIGMTVPDRQHHGAISQLNMILTAIGGGFIHSDNETSSLVGSDVPISEGCYSFPHAQLALGCRRYIDTGLRRLGGTKLAFQPVRPVTMKR